MSQELIDLKHELIIQQQKSEIMELKYKLQKTQAEKSSRLDDSLLSPSLYEHYQKVATMLSKSGVIPNAYKGKPEDIFVAMAMGYQLGFPIEQSLQDIAVVNGRPCLWGDGLLSLALNHPECQGIDEQPIIDKNGVVTGYACTVTRKGHKPHTKQFTLQDAQVAGLLSRGTTWKAYPDRMLQMRARSFAIRDKFADALRGLRITEIEEEDSRIIDVEPIAVTGNTHTEKLNSILRERNSAEGHTNGVDNPEHVNSGCSDVRASESNKTDEGNTQGDSSDNQLQCDGGITVDQLQLVHELLHEKSLSQERVKKILDYYKVSSFEELTSNKAELLLSQLGKI